LIRSSARRPPDGGQAWAWQSSVESRKRTEARPRCTTEPREGDASWCPFRSRVQTKQLEPLREADEQE
jgi:hypothetical protein